MVEGMEGIGEFPSVLTVVSGERSLELSIVGDVIRLARALFASRQPPGIKLYAVLCTVPTPQKTEKLWTILNFAR
jgi:hypothetical protein